MQIPKKHCSENQCIFTTWKLWNSLYLKIFSSIVFSNYIIIRLSVVFLMFSLSKRIRFCQQQNPSAFLAFNHPSDESLRDHSGNMSLPPKDPPFGQRASRSPPSWCILLFWLVVSTHLKNISQIGNLPQLGVKIKKKWNHHLDTVDGRNPAPPRMDETL